MVTDRLLLNLGGKGPLEGLKVALIPVDRAASVNDGVPHPACLHLFTFPPLSCSSRASKAHSHPPQSSPISYLYISYAWVLAMDSDWP